MTLVSVKKKLCWGFWHVWWENSTPILHLDCYEICVNVEISSRIPLRSNYCPSSAFSYFQLPESKPVIKMICLNYLSELSHRIVFSQNMTDNDCVCYCVSSAHSEVQDIYCVEKKKSLAAVIFLFLLLIMCAFLKKNKDFYFILVIFLFFWAL